jgi:gluconokinase
LLRGRLQRRTGHFAKADLLSSQLDALEEPTDAIVVDASQQPEAIADAIAAHLKTSHR